jgi:flagellar basal-body rod protein FlgB
MLETLDVVRMARALAAHSGARLGVAAANVANADTPGYRARDLPSFAEVYEAGGTMRATREGHIGTGGTATLTPVELSPAHREAPNGNTVSLEAEMVRMAEIRQAHDMALAVQRSVSGITRTALGRGS